MVEIGDDFDYSSGFDNKSGSDNNGFDCAKQARKFPKLTNSNLDEWEAVAILNNTKYNDPETGLTFYKFDRSMIKEFEEIEPFYDSIEPGRVKQILKEHKINEASNNKMKPWESCQYCGHGMRYIFRIMNKITKQQTIIGSTCIKYFENVEPGSEQIKKHNREILVKAFNRWANPTIKEIDINPNFQGKYKLLVKYSNFSKKLKKTDPKHCSYMDLKKIFRTAETLKLNLPFDVKGIVKERTKKKSTGLDEFV